MQMLLFYSIIYFLLLLLKDCHHLLLLLLILLLPFFFLIIIVIGITMFELLLCVFDRNIQRQVRFIRSQRCTAIQDIGPRIYHCRRGVRDSKCFGGFDCGW